MPLLMGRPAAWWSSGKSARTRRLVAVACGVAVATALVVSLCFVVGSGSTVATGFGKMTAAAAAAAAAGAHPGDQVTEEVKVVVGRRMLSGGPGSHPPRCTSKCGGCRPCYPVHVSVPRGVLVTTEYYPEAWRCKCRNQLYMP